jgi:hypothetical protein
MRPEQRHEAHGFLAEFPAYSRFGRCAVVAFVEKQVERAVNGGKPRGEVLGVRDIEQLLGTGQNFLGAGDALLDGVVRADECSGHLVHAEAAEDVQDQRDLGLLGKPRRAAGEHHAQLIVLDLLRGEKLLDGRGQRPFAFEQPAELGCEGAGRALAPQDVERTVFRGQHQPGRGILGHASEFPDLQRAAEGVLHDVFRQCQVVDSEDARERGDDAPRFPAE